MKRQEAPRTGGFRDKWVVWGRVRRHYIDGGQSVLEQASNSEEV